MIEAREYNAALREIRQNEKRAMKAVLDLLKKLNSGRR